MISGREFCYAIMLPRGAVALVIASERYEPESLFLTLLLFGALPAMKCPTISAESFRNWRVSGVRYLEPANVSQILL
jgi:hypothetical protein